jgi:long-chain acyl-CoA synthetase
MPLKRARNLGEAFFLQHEWHPGRAALIRRTQGIWTPLLWKDLSLQVFAAVEAFERSGLKAQDKIAILSQTRPEWAVLDFAAQILGLVVVPIYPSATSDDAFHILNDSETSLLFVEDSGQREKIASLRPRLPVLKHLISLEDRDKITTETDWQSFDEWGQREAGTIFDLAQIERIKAIALAVNPESPATIVYTSGTEKSPKGVVLTHNHFLETMRSVAAAIPVSHKDITLLCLPVAHILGRFEQMMMLGVGWTVAYAARTASLMDTLKEVRPTVFFGVPRIFEKIQDSLRSKIRGDGSWGRGWITHGAMEIGRRYNRSRFESREVPAALKMSHAVLDKFVFSQIRDQFGGRLRFAVSGGAALPQKTAEFFKALGLLILEGYGLTETTGPVVVNTLENYRFGTVGKPLAGTEIKIKNDGEILIRGSSLFSSYQSISRDSQQNWEEGWFKTGDLGEWDADGYLKIIGRSKELIVTSGGKNISPLKIEEQLRKIPMISQAMVVGDGHSSLAAILTLSVNESRAFCEASGIEFQGTAQLAEDPRLRESLQAQIEEMNRGLSSHERVRAFRVLTRDFSIESGELTPSLKIKRNFCAKKYSDIIEGLYK